MWVYACVRFIYEFYSWYYWWWCFSRASFLSYKNNESLVNFILPWLILLYLILSY